MKPKSKALKGRQTIARGNAPGTATPHPKPSPASPGEPGEHISPEAMRELDAWIAVHVMEWELWINSPDCQVYRTGDKDNPPQKWFHPTTNPASAQLVLGKCFDRLGGTLIGMAKLGSNYCICLPGYDGDMGEIIKATTWELAISRFAKYLFTKYSFVLSLRSARTFALIPE